MPYEEPQTSIFEFFRQRLTPEGRQLRASLDEAARQQAAAESTEQQRRNQYYVDNPTESPTAVGYAKQRADIGKTGADTYEGYARGDESHMRTSGGYLDQNIKESARQQWKAAHNGEEPTNTELESQLMYRNSLTRGKNYETTAQQRSDTSTELNNPLGNRNPTTAGSVAIAGAQSNQQHVNAVTQHLAEIDRAANEKELLEMIQSPKLMETLNRINPDMAATAIYLTKFGPKPNGQSGKEFLMDKLSEYPTAMNKASDAFKEENRRKRGENVVTGAPSAAQAGANRDEKGNPIVTAPEAKQAEARRIKAEQEAAMGRPLLPEGGTGNRTQLPRNPAPAPPMTIADILTGGALHPSSIGTTAVADAGTPGVDMNTPLTGANLIPALAAGGKYIKDQFNEFVNRPGMNKPFMVPGTAPIVGEPYTPQKLKPTEELNQQLSPYIESLQSKAEQDALAEEKSRQEKRQVIRKGLAAKRKKD